MTAPNGTDPPLLYPDYRSSVRRAPARSLVTLPATPTELTGPVFGDRAVGPLDHDLTRQHDGEPLGERIVVPGQVRDADGRPVPHSLVEIWQANSAGRYAHQVDRHPAPLDPNFTGVGRCLTDDDGRYRLQIGPFPSIEEARKAAGHIVMLLEVQPYLVMR